MTTAMMQLFVSLLVVLSVQFVAAGNSLYLYESSAPRVLEYKDNDNDFLQSTKPRVVEFYSPHCPICVDFKDEYLLIAETMQELYPMVEFYAVSCDIHDELCERFTDGGVPTLRVFRQGSDHKGVPIGDDDADHSPDELAKALGLEGFEELKKSEGADVVFAPSDDANDVEEDPDTEGMDQADDDDDQIVGEKAVFVDAPEHRERLDFDVTKKLNPNAGHLFAQRKDKALDRFKFDMQAHREDLKSQLKRLRLFGRRETTGASSKSGSAQTSDVLTDGMKAFTPGTTQYKRRQENIKKREANAKKRLRNMNGKIPKTDKVPFKSLPFKKDVRAHTVVKDVVEHIPVIGRRFRMLPEEVLILDVSNSLVTGLEAISYSATGKGLDHKQKDALREFLELLTVSLPLEWGIHRLITEILQRLDFVSENSKNMALVLNAHPLPRRGWSKSCQSTERGTGGYTCGFWKLLHVATVGLAEVRGGGQLIESNLVPPNARTFSPFAAGQAIRNYIDSFFLCEPCRKNFVENHDDCSNNRRCDRLTEEDEDASIADWKELPLWLWEVHNEVSLRVQRERSSKAKSDKKASEIEVLWPNVERCAECFNEDATWNEAEVFRHLELTFWPDSEFDPLSERLVRYDGDGSMVRVASLWMAAIVFFGVVYVWIERNRPGQIRRGVLQVQHLVQKPERSVKKRSH